jgi:recombination protein RecA
MVGRGGNSRNWLSPLFMLIHYSMAKGKVGLKVPSKNELLKKYGSSIVLASETKETGLWLPSTFFALNYTFGGGIPFGKILEVAGEESSGKSLIAYNFAYSCQQLGGHVIWVDAEQSWMNSWAQTNGVDPERVTVVNDTRIENVADAVADLALYFRSQLTHNEPILLVIDSVAAMDCADNIDSKMTDAKAEMGGRAKALYKYFRIRSELFYRLGVTQIYINQLRTALNVGFGKDNTCLHYDTMIPFVDGTSMKIGEIIKNKISKEVWSYNEEKHIFEPKPIIDWVVKPETKKWIQFKTKGPETINGFNGFTCTYTHHCLTNHGWKKAEDIDIHDKLISKQRRVINGTLRDFLWGTIPFDCSLYNGRNNSTTRITFSNGKQEDYLIWKSDMIGKAFPMKRKANKKSKLISKIGYTELRDIYNKIGKERDPLKLWDLSKPLSPITLAIWYMDDGHRYNNVTVGISISPRRTDLNRLSNYLSKVCGLDNKLYEHGIKFTNQSSIKLMEMISPYVIESMQYKLLPGYEGKYIPFTLEYQETYIPLEVEIVSINKEFDKTNRRFKRSYKRKKYDITIPDNHNFLAGSTEQGIVVHNTTTGGAALKFYASIRAAFYSGRSITVKQKGKERKAGKLVTVRLIKNKVAPPRPTISKCPVYFNPKFHEVGFDRCFGLEDVLVENDIIIKSSGGVYKLKDKTLARGEEKFQKLLEEDDDLRRKLLRKADINTIGTTRKKLEALTENYYPIDGVEYESYNESEDEEEEDDE